MNLSVQWTTLLLMALAGILLGLAYDSYRVLSWKLRFPAWMNAVLDLVYWAGAALLVFRLLYAGNQGQLRFYALLGLFLGAWLYFLIFSVTIRRFVVMLIQAVQRCGRMLAKLLAVLIGTPLLGLWRVLYGTLKLVLRVLRGMLRFLLRLTRPLWVLPVRYLKPAAERLAALPWIASVRNRFSRKPKDPPEPKE
ncbi:spore cortex biosynthesis protein YabQ [Paenibacillus spiritus]|uniref:Spore cortex biosynthesis protein YabQ n=1 Tax=Paenibacillus spiritus TaxID=2496557 RepID=A0A5J5G816_9BACL|nr:spore cortex biosynthesis protein YabQ [Paenibacillus spiritus]KAA9003604.1 spore cortex biosynthesis protein YabQ [Paenibacillus spiritus]